MSFETLKVDVADEVATVTLNRPEKLNAWTPVMGEELVTAFRALDEDPTVRVAVFTGAGDRAFCAGADMDFFASQIQSGGGMDSRTGPLRVAEFPMLLRGFSKPLIAAINGYALGVGATMTLLTDVRIAVEEAKIGFLFSRMGVMAELGSTFLLPRIVGTARACELMLSGKMFTAAECERMGLVNHVVPRSELVTTVRVLVQTKLPGPPDCDDPRICLPSGEILSEWREIVAAGDVSSRRNSAAIPGTTTPRIRAAIARLRSSAT